MPAVFNNIINNGDGTITVNFTPGQSIQKSQTYALFYNATTYIASTVNNWQNSYTQITNAEPTVGGTFTTLTFTYTGTSTTLGPGYYKVARTTGGFNVEAENTISLTPAQVGAPTITAATGTSSTTADVTWTNDTVTNKITSYVITATPTSGTGTVTQRFPSTGNLSSTLTAPVTSTVINLASNTKYTFVVTPTYSSGSGAGTPSSPSASALTYPGTPTSVSMPRDIRSLKVSWAAPSPLSSNTGTDIASLTYTATISPAPTSGSASQTISSLTSVPVTFSNLLNGTSYTVSIVATNSSGSSSVPATITTTTYDVPTAPQNPAAVSNASGAVTLTWDPPSSDGGQTVTSYRVDVSGGTSYTGITETTATISTGLTNGTTYTFNIYAINAVGTSTLFATVTGKPYTTPNAPASLSVVAPVESTGANTLKATWTAPSFDGGSTVTSYKIYIALASTPDTPIDSIESVSSSTFTNTFTGLTRGTYYKITVLAVNARGDGIIIRSDSITPNSVPSTPSSVIVAPISTSGRQVTLTWTDPSDNGGTTTQYYYTISYYNQLTDPTGSSPSSTGPIMDTLASTTTYTFNDLTNGEPYIFTIYAHNIYGNSTPISTSATTPLSNDTSLSIFKLNDTDIVDGDNMTLSNNTAPTIVATPTDPNATVQILGGTNLHTCSNTLTVIVTAQDGTEQIYTVTLNVPPIQPSISVSDIRQEDGSVRVTVTVTNVPDPCYETYTLYQRIYNVNSSSGNPAQLYTGPFIDGKDGNSTPAGVFVLDIPRLPSQKYYYYYVIATCPNNVESQPSAESTAIDIPCLPRGTQILTPSGYRPVEMLVTGDLVQTEDGRAVPIRMHRYEVAASNAKSAPVQIAAGTFGGIYPVAPLRVSPWHAFKVGAPSENAWQLPKDVLGMAGVIQEPFGQPIEYFHIELPNYLTDNLVIDGGVAVESYGIPWKISAGYWGQPTYIKNDATGFFERITGV